MKPSSLEILQEMVHKAKVVLAADATELAYLERALFYHTAGASFETEPRSTPSPEFVALVAVVKAEVRQDFLKAIQRNEDGFREQLRRALRL